MTRVRSLAVVLLLALATAAHASWYDDYDAGVAAARGGNWNTVIAKMSSAIKGNPTENNKARTYGAIFINYHPYYYRGVAYLNVGKYEQAITDLERTSGAGPENLGSIGELLDRAKKQLAASSAPEPEPVRPEPTPVRPPVTQTVPAPVQQQPAPSVPAIDPALRQRAASALGAAKQKLQQAQQRRASASPQYAQALSLFTDATTRNGAAKNNEDLQSIISMAENAGNFADLAMPPNAPAPVPTRPATAADTVLSDYRPELRRALENYFNGEFEDSSRQLAALTRKLPTNAWIWAFLGASQYSQFAFEADESYRAAALQSFRKAKSLRSWKGGLPEKYFSRRIRRAFNDEG
jgi:tetratricopeptide (TPR) repeat protein